MILLLCIDETIQMIESNQKKPKYICNEFYLLVSGDNLCISHLFYATSKE